MTIDLSNAYFTPEFMSGGTSPWTLDRNATPYRAIALHHAAGWYGQALGVNARQDTEERRIEAMAHDQRQRLGIGPAYNYVVFSSRRVYAVGKVGTHRAHTKGRNPATGERWNVEAIAICAMGDYETAGRDELSPGLALAIEDAVNEIRGFPFTVAGAPVHGHGVIPTVNSAGDVFPQNTACPGRRLTPLIAELNGAGPTPPPVPPPPQPPPPDVSAELATIRAALDEIERKVPGGRSGGCPARRRTSAAVRCSGYLSLGTPYTRSISGITLEGGA